MEQKTIEQIVIEDAKEHNPENPRSYLKDVIANGCVSGTCSGLVYYRDTVAFYDKHAEEIEDLLEDYRQDAGFNNRLETIASLNGADDVVDIETEKNLLAWFAYETVAWQLLNEDDFGVND